MSETPKAPADPKTPPAQPDPPAAPEAPTAPSAPATPDPEAEGPCPECFPFGPPEGAITFGCSHS